MSVNEGHGLGTIAKAELSTKIAIVPVGVTMDVAAGRASAYFSTNGSNESRMMVGPAPKSRDMVVITRIYAPPTKEQFAVTGDKQSMVRNWPPPERIWTVVPDGRPAI